LVVDTNVTEVKASVAVPQYFAAYEQAFGLPVYWPVKVTVVCDRSERLRVETDRGDVSARGIINATGTWETPYIPGVPGAKRFTGRQLHTVGDPAARLVLVHLNPKHRNNDAPTYQGERWLPTFEQYWEHFQHFGERTCGPNSPRSWRSVFDHKQIRFLRPFGVIDFGADVWQNLERVIDHKLQLELVPYGSDTFSNSGFTPAILRPHAV
jgi:hypothetical protein